MNKNLLVTVLVAVGLIAAAAGAYIFLGESNDNTQSNSVEGSISQEDDRISESEVPANQTGSLRTLLTLGRSQRCTYTDSEVSGVVYLSRDNMRTDYTSTDPETPSGSMIMTKDKIYAWSDTTNEGFVMDRIDDSANNQDEGGGPVDGEDIDINEE